MPQETNFLQTNIWGIVGAFSGVIALIISFLNWGRSRPKIVVTKVSLVRKNPMQIAEWFNSKSKDQIRDHILDFDLHIVIINKSSSSGSIEKPRLVFSTHSGKKISIAPYKAYSEPADKLNPAAWKFKSKELETTWKLEGGEIVEDDIKYVVENADDIYEIVDNYTVTAYLIEFTDNFGKIHKMPISSVFEEK